MATRNEIPPEVVNHLNKDPTDDRPENLSAHTKEESDLEGSQGLENYCYQSWQRLLEYIEFTGETPPDDSHLWK